jgi:hypothetical protein
VSLVLFLLAGFALPSGAGAATQTLIVSTAHPIHGIATSSSSLVWRQDRGNSRGGCATWVRRRSWRTHTVSDVYRCGFNGGGGGSYNDWYGDLAMGTSKVAFSTVGYDFDCCKDFVSVALHTPRLGIRDNTFHILECEGDEIVNLAAHAGLAAYTRSSWSLVDPTADCANGGFDTPGDTLTGGPVDTLSFSGGSPRPLTGAPPAAFIGLSARSIALVPYDLVSAPVNQYPQPLPQIQVWSLATRARIHTIAEAGSIKALDMTGKQIAVLVAGISGNLRIDRFSATTGARTGSTRVPAQTAPMLAIYYRWIAYVVGTRVLALNTHTGTSHTVAQPTYKPRQILAVRGKAVWYASAHGWGRILSAPLQ